MTCQNVRGTEFDHVVAFIDILGSSQILRSGDDKAIKDYLLGIEGMYTRSREHVSDGIKMFSDNILIYSQGSTIEDVKSIITSVAMIQWSVMKDFNLFIRGGVVIGRLEKVPEGSADYIIGRAVVEAHELESRVAAYPRVVVSEDVAKLCGGSDPLIKADWDHPFIDYLQLSLDEGSLSDDLESYRGSLINHIENNNLLRDCSTEAWDRIRSKDVWALSYYNEFCRSSGSDDLAVDFSEHYDPSVKRIRICIEGEEGGVACGND